MIELELGGVQQRPEDIVVRLAISRVGSHQRHEFPLFRLGWLARQRTDEQFVDDFVGPLPVLQHSRNNCAAVQFTLDGVAIYQVQRLRQRRLQTRIGGKHRVALAKSERLQEIIVRQIIALIEFDGAQAVGRLVELRGRAGRFGDGVEEHVCAQAPQVLVRKLVRVVAIGLVRRGGELIGARIADVADQAAGIEVISRQMLAQRLQQFPIARRIADAHIVHRVDDAAPEELRPHAIGQILAEENVVL